MLMIIITLMLMIMMLQVGAANKKITLLMVGLDNAGKTCTAKTIVGEVIHFDRFIVNIKMILS